MPMKEMPANQLNPKMKIVWRISDAVSLTIAGLVLSIPLACVFLFAHEQWALYVSFALVAGYVIGLVVCLAVLPQIRFVRWRYELTDDYLDIARGIIWRKRFVIPFIRVQNTDTQQGPILRAFKLASVTVSTAAGKHEIPGLDVMVAEQVRDKAAELARLAQEDI